MTPLPVILCVDDDAAMLAAVVRCLKRDGLDVRSTVSASEALAMIASDEVAVLVSDYDMPEMTGAQLAAKVRRVRPETVRILLTGKRTLETAVDGINQGEVFRFLSKPYVNAELRQAVLEAVVRHGELVAMSGDRARRERREALRLEVEAEFPGISTVDRAPGQTLVVTEDPWSEAAELELAGISRLMETT